MTLNKVSIPGSIFGNKLYHFAHNFMIGSQLNHEPFSLRLKRSVKALDLKALMRSRTGLCNAVILS